MPLLTQITTKQLTTAGQPLLVLEAAYTGFTLDKQSYDEGETITATVTTVNVPDGTTVNYTSTGISANDITSGSLSGVLTITSNVATLQLALAQDGLTEGTDNFTITLAATDSEGVATGGLNATAQIIDTSNDPTKALFLDDNDDPVTIATIVGSTSMQLNGVFAVNPVVPFGIEGRISGAATTVISVTANTGTLIEIDDTGNSNNFIVNEQLNLSGISVSVTPSANNVDEGSSVSFTVTTSGLPDGYTLYYTTSLPGDLNTGSGPLTINSNTATVVITPTEDSLTEGSETFTVSIRSESTTGNVLATSSAVTINDTSIAPTYDIVPAAGVVNEGSPLGITVNTTLVPDGTQLDWAIQTNASDFSVASGTVTINSNTGTFSVTPTADFTTEGAETFTISISTQGAGAEIVTVSDPIGIVDTSTDPTYTLSGPASELSEGDTFTITLTTTGVSDGTQLAYTMTGITNDDLTAGSLTGNFTVTSGTATANFTLSEDLSTNNEGTEVISVTLDNGLSNTYTNNVIDTSKIDWQISVTGVSSGNRNYIMSGEDILGSFTSETDPTLNMVQGDTIEFDVGISGHPFWIKTAPTTGTGDAVSGVINNGGQNTTVRWTANSSGTYYYQCEFHTRMNGTINVSPEGSSFYKLTAPGNTVTEGNTLVVTLTTTSISDGTTVPYTVTGITSADLTAGSLTGNFTVNNNTATQSFTFAADALSENETFTIALDNGTSSLDISITDA